MKFKIGDMVIINPPSGRVDKGVIIRAIKGLYDIEEIGNDTGEEVLSIEEDRLSFDRKTNRNKRLKKIGI